ASSSASSRARTAASRAPPASGSRSCATSCRHTVAGSSSTARSGTAAASRSSCQEARGGAMASILVVDDEKNIRAHLATYLGSLGHRVETANDGTEALSSLD